MLSCILEATLGMLLLLRGHEKHGGNGGCVCCTPCMRVAVVLAVPIDDQINAICLAGQNPVRIKLWRPELRA
jgi:hypothetical protein